MLQAGLDTGCLCYDLQLGCCLTKGIPLVPHTHGTSDCPRPLFHPTPSENLEISIPLPAVLVSAHSMWKYSVCLIVPSCSTLLADVEDNARCFFILGITNTRLVIFLLPWLCPTTVFSGLRLSHSSLAYIPFFLIFDHTSYCALWIQWEEQQESLLSRVYVPPSSPPRYQKIASLLVITYVCSQVRGWELAHMFAHCLNSDCRISSSFTALFGLGSCFSP